MENCQVHFKLLDKYAIPPKTQSLGAAGYDLHSVKTVSIPGMSTISMKLGFALSLPSNLFGYICGRSGFAKNHGVNVENSYVKNGSEVEIHITNYTNEPFKIEKGMRVAQMFFAIAEDVQFDLKKD